MRAAATALLSTAALGAGLWAADLASRNAALGRELDRRQRLCEALAVSVDRLEWRVRAAERELLLQIEGAPGRSETPEGEAAP